MKENKKEGNVKKGFWRGFSGFYGVLFAVISLIVVFLIIVGSFVLYQAYGISDSENYELEQVDIEQAASADSVANSSDLFD